MHLMSRKREPMDWAILGVLLLGIGMALALHGRTWLLFSHALPGEEAFITNSLASREIIPRFTFQAAGSSAYLVDLN